MYDGITVKEKVTTTREPDEMRGVIQYKYIIYMYSFVSTTFFANIVIYLQATAGPTGYAS